MIPTLAFAVSVNIIGIILVSVVFFSTDRNNRFAMPDHKIFCVLIYVTMASLFIEIAALVFDGATFPGAEIVIRLTNSMLFVSVPSAAYLWVLFARRKLIRGKLNAAEPYILSLPLVAVSALGIINLFTDVIYTVTEDNLYERTPLFIIPFILTYIYLLYAAALILSRRKVIRKKTILSMLTFMVFPLTAGIIQYLFYGVSFIWVSICISIVMIYINVQSDVGAVDSLTGLYNRRQLETYLSDEVKRGGGDAGESLYVIMLDIDAFKSINSRYGYSEGDDALRILARVINGNIADGDFASRYSNDEFIVVLKRKNELDVINTIKALMNGISYIYESGEKPYKMFASVAYRQAGEDDTCESLISGVDRMVSEQKKAKKSGTAAK